MQNITTTAPFKLIKFRTSNILHYYSMQIIFFQGIWIFISTEIYNEEHLKKYCIYITFFKSANSTLEIKSRYE